MILYKDLFMQGDVFTDVYKMELVDDMYFKIHGKYIMEDREVDESCYGGNKSAEAEDDDTDADSGKVLIPDIVSSNNLEKTASVVTKSDWKNHIKDYSKKLLDKVGETDADRAKFLKDNLKDKFVMPMLKDFKNFTVYSPSGDEFDVEGTVILFSQEDVEEEAKVGTKCYMIVLKDGLEIEKC